MNGDKIIKLKQIIIGYCCNCHRPTIVGFFELNGWWHQFQLCELCLRKFADEIVVKTNDTVKEKQTNNKEEVSYGNNKRNV